MKAVITITVDELGNLETKSNVVLIEQQRDILNLALKTLGSPKVYGGLYLGKEKSNFRRPVSGDRKVYSGT